MVTVPAGKEGSSAPLVDSVTSTVRPAATVPRVQVSTRPSWVQVPWVAGTPTAPTPAGSVSVSTTSWASEGPALTSSRPQLTGVPATAVAGAEAVSVRSARDRTGSSRVAVTGSGEVALLAVPATVRAVAVEDAASVTGTVTVSTAPGARVAASQRTVPPSVRQTPPFPAAPSPRRLMPSGSRWLKATSAAVEGPVLVTVNV